MRIRATLILICMTVVLSGCVGMNAFCFSNCRSQTHQSSSLVSFLYPNGNMPLREDVMPELRLPLRVGLAFLPSRRGENVAGLEATRRDEILQRIREHFSSRQFVSEIIVVPEYYLAGARGFDGLEGVQRLYNIDVMALVSYDQVTYQDENKLSMGYLTIVGAYLIKGNRHDVTTLLDLAVIDPASRSILLRAGGADTRHGNTTLVDADRESRESRTEGFSASADRLIANFDTALTQFETSVREGRANVRVVRRNGGQSHSGGGALDPLWCVLLGGALFLRRRRR